MHRTHTLGHRQHRPKNCGSTVPWLWIFMAVTACAPQQDDTNTGDPQDDSPSPMSDSNPDFPAIFRLSSVGYDATLQQYRPREFFVVAAADGTYTSHFGILFGETYSSETAPVQRGEWRQQSGQLEFRPYLDDVPELEWTTTYFADYLTTAAPTDLRLTRCLDDLSLTFDYLGVSTGFCFAPDGTYVRRLDTIGDFNDATQVDGTYFIDGYQMTLTEGTGEQARTALAVLDGPADSPTEIMVAGSRFSLR